MTNTVKIKLCRSLLLIIIIPLLLFGCKYNPLFEDELNASDGHTIRGTIQLQEGESYDDVFVWLEQLKVGTYTDSKGNFSLKLPLPILQPGNGFTGESKLYYYLENYSDSFSTVRLLNGKIIHGQLDVSNKGKISKTISLQRLATIRTSVEPDTISAGYTGQINIHVKVSPGKVPVVIHTFFGSAVIYKYNDDPVEDAVFVRMSTILSRVELNTSISWNTTLNANAMELKEGQYTFTPYIEFDHPDIPEYLFDALDGYPGEFSNKYLNIPFKRSGGILTVIQE